MRKMISAKTEKWAESLKEHVAQNGDTTEVGGKLEVDGVIKSNSKIMSVAGYQSVSGATYYGTTEDDEDVEVFDCGGEGQILVFYQDTKGGSFVYMCDTTNETGTILLTKTMADIDYASFTGKGLGSTLTIPEGYDADGLTFHVVVLHLETNSYE